MLAAPLALLALVAATAPPPSIGSGEAARRVCLATAPPQRYAMRPFERRAYAAARERILGTEFEAVFPLEQLDLLDVDEATRELELSRRDLVKPAPGVHLFVEDMKIVLPVVDDDAAQRDRAVATRAVEALSRPGGTVRLRYELVDDDGAGPCLSPTFLGSIPVVRIEPKHWELRGPDGTLLARGTGRVPKDPRPPPGGVPLVAVSPATVEGEGPLASVVTRSARLQGHRLHASFDDALGRDPRLDGSLVLQVDIDSDGVGHDLLVTADSVNDPKLVDCARAALRDVAWGKGGPSLATIPIHFERER